MLITGIDGFICNNCVEQAHTILREEQLLSKSDFTMTELPKPKEIKAFLDEYGMFDPVEKALDDVVSVVVTLHLACQRDVFPWWAQSLLDELDSTFIEKMECLRRLL